MKVTLIILIITILATLLYDAVMFGYLIWASLGGVKHLEERLAKVWHISRHSTIVFWIQIISVVILTIILSIL